MGLFNGIPVMDDRFALGFRSSLVFATSGVVVPSQKFIGRQVVSAPVMTFRFTYSNQFLADIRLIRRIFAETEGRNGHFLMPDMIQHYIRDQLIGTGSGAPGQTAQCVMDINLTGSLQRTIKYIRPGTLVVTTNGAVTTDYTEANGLLTFGAAITSGHEIRIRYCEFWYYVKWDSDSFEARRIEAPADREMGKIGDLSATEQPE